MNDLHRAFVDKQNTGTRARRKTHVVWANRSNRQPAPPCLLSRHCAVLLAHILRFTCRVRAYVTDNNNNITLPKRKTRQLLAASYVSVLTKIAVVIANTLYSSVQPRIAIISFLNIQESKYRYNIFSKINSLTK